MKVIFAQGNPGDQYTKSRHNVGFMVLDALAQSADTSWRVDTKFKAGIAELTLENEKVLLVKPLSYYNQTGQVARSIVDFYKLEPSLDLLVLHDELALPFGTIRVREKGSDGGNNGIKSLNAHLGENYARIRVGIWNELRDRIDDADFVLSNFTEKERAELSKLIEEHIIPLIQAFLQGNLEATSQKLAK